MVSGLPATQGFRGWPTARHSSFVVILSTWLSQRRWPGNRLMGSVPRIGLGTGMDTWQTGQTLALLSRL